MNKFFLVIISLLPYSISFAAPMSEEAKVCYIFQNNKLKDKSTCIVSSGYGAGGTYESIQIGKREINVETSMCYDKKADNNIECGTTLNDDSAKFYNRDLFYKRIDDESLITDSSLSCYKSKKLDVCHN